MPEPNGREPIPTPPPRPTDAHKGTFGTVVVVGGSPTMIGAPAMAAQAALRIGAGLVRIACPTEVMPFALTIEPSATGIALDFQARADDAAEQLERDLDDKSVLAVGPGMGVGEAQTAFVEALLRRPYPTVLDADGLNNLARLADAATVSRCPLVMTPHPGEFRRLAEAAALHFDPTDPQARPDAAAAMAHAFGAVVVLKGPQTVVSDGERCYRNGTGNAALATAGTGDVLTGAIAGLLAQGLSPFEAAALGAHVHGGAADAWAQRAGQAGLLARALADALPRALEQCRGPAASETHPSPAARAAG